MKNIFRTIVRNFIRKPVTNLINLFGLAISMVLVIIISVYCYSELTTDDFHKNGDRVYLYGLSGDRIYTPGILKEHIDMKIPGVESTVRISGTWDVPVFQVENNEPFMSDLMYVDEDFFKLFTYTFIEGTPETALNEPMTVVITERLSDKLFGKEEAMGKMIKLNNNQSLTVNGVIEEPKANSCLSFSSITSIATRKIVQNEPGEYTEWGWRDFQTFVLLKEGTDPDETGRKILSLFPEDNQEILADTGLTPLRKIYFSDFTLYGSNYLVSGDKRKVQILVLVAVLVLMIALVNFINISSSQWQEKIKQTGIMKVVGARQLQILRDVLAESFIFFLAALIIAIEIVNSINPFIRSFTGIQYSQRLTYSAGFIIVSLAIILLLSIIFSIIPALRISRSKVLDNLNKTVKSNEINFSFRSVFVTMQFIIAIVLIAFTVLIQKQVRFGSNDLGFNKDNIIGIKMTEQLAQKKEVLTNLLAGIPGINKVAFTQYYPGKDISQWGTQSDIDGETKQLNFYTFSADAAVFEMMGLQLVSGRFYSEDLSSDKGKVVVNETFLREHELDNPVGNKISMGNRSWEIIGIVKDFHFKPVNQPIASLVMRNDFYTSVCLVSIQEGDYKTLHNTLDKIRNIVSMLSPSFPVEVSFFDQAIQNMYQSELRFRRIFSLLAGCALVICSLGILAMSLFACQRRVKEVGIRKVNGATISEILAMLNKDFVKWVLVAFAISTPVAWYIMHRWLESFAYKTGISWWIFALSGLITLGIALLTVSWQSWRAATRNPVEALRYE
ncbi:MAG: ABC transporter permease [Bacteroidota bacterium]